MSPDLWKEIMHAVNEVLQVYDSTPKLLREFAALMRVSPHLASALAADLAQMLDHAGIGVGYRPRVDSRFDAVAKLFLGNGNQPLRKEAIADSAGVNLETVRTLLYRKQSHCFARVASPDGGRSVLFNLTKEALRAAEGRTGVVAT